MRQEPFVSLDIVSMKGARTDMQRYEQLIAIAKLFSQDREKAIQYIDDRIETEMENYYGGPYEGILLAENLKREDEATLRDVAMLRNMRLIISSIPKEDDMDIKSIGKYREHRLGYYWARRTSPDMASPTPVVVMVTALGVIEMGTFAHFEPEDYEFLSYLLPPGVGLTREAAML